MSSPGGRDWRRLPTVPTFTPRPRNCPASLAAAPRVLLAFSTVTGTEGVLGTARVVTTRPDVFPPERLTTIPAAPTPARTSAPRPASNRVRREIRGTKNSGGLQPA